MINMFEWKPEYSVQIPEIDAQHQRLFSLAAKMHGALAEGKGRAVLETSLSDLIDYTKVHFSSEETFMGRHNYPDLVAHRILHDKLVDQVNNLQKRFRSGQAMLSLELMIFLKTWLEHHIGESDQQYSAYIRAAGITH